MVALITDSGLGLFNAFQAQGGVGGAGTAGQAGGRVSVNTATGNLILQFQDEQLSGTGADLRHLRTYNSQGSVSDGDGDRWRWAGEKRVVLSGTRNTAGSTVTRITGDGHEAVYNWNGSAYVSSDGTGAHDTIVWDGSSSGEWQWTDGSSRSQERYSASSGWITMFRDMSNNGFNYTFSGDRLTKVADIKSGQTLELVYSNSRVARLDTRTTASGALTRQVYYTYDSSGRLTQVRTDLTPTDNAISDNNIYTTTYGYDGTSFRIASISQSDGTSANITYDSSGRVKTVIDQFGTTTFTYNSTNTQVANGAGEVWTYYHDSQGRLSELRSQTVGSVFQSTKYAYDSSDNITSITDSLGKIISYQYDSSGNLTREEDAEGNVVTRTYSNNLLVTQTSYAGGGTSGPQTSRFVYDTNRLLRFTISAEGRVSENRYDANGQVTHSIQYAGNTYNVASLGTTATLSLSQLTTWVNAANDTQTQQTQYSYDYRGNLTRTTQYGSVNSSGVGEANNHRTITDYIYSEYGELLQTIAVTGSTSTTLSSAAYDGMGRQISVVNANGTTSTAYNSGSIVVSNSVTGASITSAYDSRGRLLSLTQSGDSTNRITRYYYDNAGRLRMSEDATGGRSYIFYDAAGRVTHKVNATGSVVGYTYDANGRVLNENHYLNTVSTSSWFNGTSVTQTSVSVTANANDRQIRYAYDDAGRLLTTTEENGSADRISTVTYDGASRITSSSIGSRTTKFYYDKDGKKIGELNAAGYFIENVYDAAGRLSKIIRYERVVSSALQASGDFNGIQSYVTASGATLSSHYFYDAHGRLLGEINEQGFLTEIIYEPQLKRRRDLAYLTPVTVSGSDTLATVKSRAGTSQTTTTNFDNHGRVSTVQTVDGTMSSNTYDNAGRLIRTVQAQGTTDQRATRMRYNAFDEVTGVVSGVGEATLSTSPTTAQINTAITNYGESYKYDAMGRKIESLGTASGGQKTWYYYDQSGRLTYSVNALGEVRQTTYTSFGEVDKVKSYVGRISVSGLTGGAVNSTLTTRISGIASSSDSETNTDYNRLGLVSDVYNAENKRTQYVYNSNGDLTDVYLPHGSGAQTRTHYTYDGLGRTTEVSRDHGGISSTTVTNYDAFGRVSFTEDANQNRTDYDYQENGRKIVITDPLNRTQTTTYDAFGRTLTTKDGNNKQTTYTYNDAARSFTVVSAEGISITTQHTRTGEILSVNDGNSNTTTYTYTKDGNLDTVTNGLTNVVVNNDYDASGRLYEVRDGNNNITRYSYDAANRTVQVAVDPNGLNLRTTYVFDGQGRQTRVTEGDGTTDAVVTDYKYNKNGQLIQTVLDPSGLRLSTRFTYDDGGQQIRMERGTANSSGSHVSTLQRTDIFFDKLGRKTKEVVAPGDLDLTTEYKYDANGNLTRIINADSDSTWFVYNTANEQVFAVNGVGEVKQYFYDKNGRVHHTREFFNQINTSTFGDEVTSISISANANDRRHFVVYDDDGRERFTVTATDGTQWSITESIYDNNSNVVESRRYDVFVSEQDINTKAGTSSFDLTEAEVLALLAGEGRNASSLGNTRRTFFAYDAANRLRFTVNAEGYVTESKYDAAGNLRYQTHFNDKPALGGNYSETNISSKVNRASALNRESEYRYDSANRLAVEYGASTSFRLHESTTTVTSRIYSTTSYDALGRVVARRDGQSSYSSGRLTQYEYDKAGRQTKTLLPGYYDYNDGRVYLSNASDRFRRTIEVGYDAVGNAVSNTIQTGSGTYVYQYKTYDAAGRLIHDIDALGAVTRHVYSGSQLESTTRLSSTYTTTPSRGYWLASEITGTAGRKISYSYDAAGRRVNTLMPYGSNNYAANSGAALGGTSYTAAQTVAYIYNAFGEVVKESTKIDNTRYADAYFYYDRIGRQTGSVDAEKYGVKTEYDELGNVRKRTEYAKATTSTPGISSMPAFTNTVGISDPSRDRITRYNYDALGQVTQVWMDNISYGYSGSSSSPWGIVSNASAVMSRSEYDAFGSISKSYDALGNVTNFEYNNLGQLTKMVEPQRQVAGTANDPFQSQVSTAKPETTYIYDVFGNVVREQVKSSTTSARGATITQDYKYDLAGNEYQLTDGEGGVLTKSFDVSGKVTKEAKLASASKIIYDTYGNGTTVSLYQHTLQRLYEYDKTGRLEYTLDVFGGKKTGVKNVYNQYGEVLSERKVWGSASTASSSLSSAIVSEYLYDGAGRITRKRGMDGYTHYYYDLAGNVTRTQQRGTDNSTTGQRTTETYHDKLARALIQRMPSYYGTASITSLTESTTSLLPVVQQDYDRWGNVTSRTDAAGGTTSYKYNHANQIVSEVLPTGTVYRANGTSYSGYTANTFVYDRLGNMAQEKAIAYNSSGTAQASVQSYMHFNAVGQTIKEYDRTGKLKQYAYDIHGNKVGEKNGVNVVTINDFDKNNQQVGRYLLRSGSLVQLTKYQYDQAGRKYAEFDASNNAQYSKYDELNNLVAHTNLNGATKTIQYDDLGRKKKVTDYVTSNIEQWTYSSSSYTVDRIATHTSANGKVYTHTYNRFGQLDQEQATGASVQYDYWENGLLKKITDTDTTGGTTRTFTTSIHYNVLGNRSFERYDSLESWVDYNPYGSGGTQTASASFKTMYSYDALGRLSHVKSPAGTMRAGSSTKGTATIVDMEYRYDEWSNRRAIVVSYKLPGSSTQSSKTEWFKYDNAGRVLVESGVLSGGDIVANKTRGVVYTYDAAGRRATAEKWHSAATEQVQVGTSSYGSPIYETQVVGEKYQEQKFNYNDLGLVGTVQQRFKTRAVNATSYGSVSNTTSYSTIESNTYDNRGYKTETVLNGKKTTSTYKADGRVSSQIYYNSNGSVNMRLDAYNYDAAGNITSYRMRQYTYNGTYNFTNNYTYSYVNTFTGRQVSTISATTSQSGTAEGNTYNSYDQRGRLRSSSITESSGSTTGRSYKYFAYDAEGQIIGRMEKKYGQTVYKVQSHYYHGNNSISDIGDFGVNISPLGAIYEGGDTPGSYTVNTGDTLAGIAQMLFGDSQLWYTLAETNGLAMGPSDQFAPSEVGRTLKVPNTDVSVRNHATTFKPYNSAEIIGDLTPEPSIVPPPPPKKSGCSKIAQIVMIVVAVVVTIYTAGAATAYFAGGATATASTGAVVAGGFVGGVAGSVASQAVGVAFGVSNGIDLRQAFASGIAGGITAGVGNVLSNGGSAFAKTVGEGAKQSRQLTALGQSIHGASSVAANVLANKVAGLDSSFSWASVAAGAISGAVSGGLGLNSSIDAATGLVKPGEFLSSFAQGFAGSAIGATSQRLMGVADKADWSSIALDSFGNALGQGIAANYGLAELGAKHGSALRDRFSPSAAQSASTVGQPEMNKNPNGGSQTQKNQQLNNLTDEMQDGAKVSALQAKPGDKIDQQQVESVVKKSISAENDDLNVALDKVNEAIVNVDTSDFSAEANSFLEEYKQFIDGMKNNVDDLKLRHDEFQDGFQDFLIEDSNWRAQDPSLKNDLMIARNTVLGTLAGMISNDGGLDVVGMTQDIIYAIDESTEAYSGLLAIAGMAERGLGIEDEGVQKGLAQSIESAVKAEALAEGILTKRFKDLNRAGKGPLKNMGDKFSDFKIGAGAEFATWAVLEVSGLFSEVSKVFDVDGWHDAVKNTSDNGIDIVAIPTTGKFKDRPVIFEIKATSKKYKLSLSPEQSKGAHSYGMLKLNQAKFERHPFQPGRADGAKELATRMLDMHPAGQKLPGFEVHFTNFDYSNRLKDLKVDLFTWKKR